MFLACCEVFTHFSLSIRIDNNFLIIIAGDSTTYLLLSVYFKSKCEFSVFLVKNANSSHSVRYLKEFTLVFWLLLNFSFHYFWIHMHTY